MDCDFFSLVVWREVVNKLVTVNFKLWSLKFFWVFRVYAELLILGTGEDCDFIVTTFILFLEWGKY